MKIEHLTNIHEFTFKDIFDGCTYPWEVFLKISGYLKKNSSGEKKSFVPPGVFLENPDLITIGEHVIIEPGAYIKGPCIIGDHVVIRHGAYIRENVILGAYSVVGHASEVKNSIFFNHSKAPHFNYVGDSILGKHVNLGAGVKCGNVRLDKREITIRTGKEKLRTGLTKLGVILGDHVSVGCNTVFNPGTVIGKNTTIYPCINVSGCFPENSVIRETSK